MKITVVIPAFNEAQAIGDVVRAVPGDGGHDIIVVDNDSTDDTAKQAALAGARVIHESRRGYGSACLAGAKAVPEILSGRDHQARGVVVVEGAQADQVLAVLLQLDAAGGH